MTDGYEPWIAIAPEGKVPVRSGDTAGSTEYTDAWAEMEVGVDTKAPLSEFYGQDVIDALTAGTDSLVALGDPAGPGRPARRDPGRAAGGRRGQRGRQRHRPGGGRDAGRRRHARGRRVLAVSIERAHRPAPGDRGAAAPAPPSRRRGAVGPPAPARTGGSATCSSRRRSSSSSRWWCCRSCGRSRWPSSRSGCSTCARPASSATTAWRTSATSWPRPGSSTPWSPRWSTRSPAPRARSASACSRRWRCGSRSAAGASCGPACCCRTSRPSWPRRSCGRRCSTRSSGW